MNSESSVQQSLRLEAARRGVLLMRNNVGACSDAKTGRQIRFGLGNDSAKINKVFKSSDLIGLWPVRITQDMVGMTIGQFVAVEVKRPDWRFTGTEREMAQQAFGQKMMEHGGMFFFASSVQDIFR